MSAMPPAASHWSVAAAETPIVPAEPSATRLEPEAVASGSTANAPLQWSFNPWRQDLKKALIGVISAAAVTALLPGLGLPPLAVAVLALVFLATVHSAFLPTRYRVDEEGVARRLAFGWERRPWRAIRRAALGPRGLFVSPRLHPGPLDSFRGLWLPVPIGAAPTLMAELRAHLARHGLSS